MRIYFDSCCYSRRQDDLTVRRNAVEAEAIEEIIDWVRENDHHTIIGSEMVEIELMDNNDADARDEDKAFFRDTIGKYVDIDVADAARTQAFIAAGLGEKDSVHLAIAEAVRASVLVTVDKAFVRISNRNKLSEVRVVNPLDF